MFNGETLPSVGNGSDFIRKSLQGYGTTSNIKMNAEIQQMRKEGRQIHHLAFGQSPFPVPEKLRKALEKNAHKNDYVSVSGRHVYYYSYLCVI